MAAPVARIRISSPILVLKVQDPPGSRPRTVSSFTLAPLSSSFSAASSADADVLADAFEAHSPSDAVRVLLVTIFYRGAVLPAPSSPSSGFSLLANDPSRSAEWNRFAAYLRHGVEGKSAPKAALCGVAGGKQFVILPPASAPSADNGASPVPLTIFRWHSAVASTVAEVGPATTIAAPIPAASTGTRVIFVPPSPDALGKDSLPQGEAVYRSQGKTFVSKAEVNAALLSGQLEALKNTWVKKIVSGEVPFPFKKHCISDEQVREWFAILRRYHQTVNLSHHSFAPLHGYYPKGGSFEATVTWPISASRSSAMVGGGGGGGGGRVPLSLSFGASIKTIIGPEQTTFVARLPANSSKLSSGTAAMAFLPFDKPFNEIGSALVDFFSEPARMLAVRKDEGAPPLELWRNEDVARFVVEKALRKYGDLTDFSLRHGLYGKVAGCNLFKCHLASAIYTFLGGTRILDPCAGWGDRLLGAMGTPAVKRYLAFDPNPALVPCHQGMIATLKPLATEGADYQVSPVPFEEGVIPAADGKPAFDLVMTSPPYFTLELYEDERRKGLVPPPTSTSSASSSSSASAVDGTSTAGDSDSATSKQSTVSYPTLEEWLERWYFPMMAKAWAQLMPGGHMAFYINDHLPKQQHHQQKKRNFGAGAAASSAGPVAGQKRSWREAQEGSSSSAVPPAAVRTGKAEAGADAGDDNDDEDDIDSEILMCLPMLRYAGKHLPGCVWVGCVGIEGENGHIRPLWVWRKQHENAVGATATAALPTNAEGQVAPIYVSLGAHLAGVTARS